MTENTTTPPTGLTSYQHRFQLWKRVSLRETPLTNQGLHNHCGILHPSTISRQLYHIMVITNFHPRGISPTCQRVIVIHVHDHLFRKQTSQIAAVHSICVWNTCRIVKKLSFGRTLTSENTTSHTATQYTALLISGNVNKNNLNIFYHHMKKHYPLLRNDN